MDTEKQRDEITALESIYNQEEFSYIEKDDQFECLLKISVNLPDKYCLQYNELRDGVVSPQKVQISYLPPLILHVVLPKDYPSRSAPKFTLSCSWLYPSALGKLCKKFDLLWNREKQEILFIWVEFLQNETLEFLKIKEYLNMNYVYEFYKRALERSQISQTNNKVDEPSKHCNNEDNEKKKKLTKQTKNIVKKVNFFDKRAILDYPVAKNPIQILISYNEKLEQIEFKKRFYTCNICFTDKSGEYCTQFMPCSHIFCKDCIKDYFEIKIKEGHVKNIHCPEEKCKFEATPGQIKDLVSPELFSKYDSMLLNVTLDTMADIIYCPRRRCQYPVTRNPDEQMAECPVCQYVFCVYCRMLYHGVEPCKVSLDKKQELISGYQTASNEEKARMEQIYGKRNLQILVENVLSENWVNNNSHNCPNCKTAIQKLDGCNKMTCSNCGTYFCWLCGARLNHDTPYSHFQTPDSKCFNMLHYGIIPDEEDMDDDDDFDFHAEYLDFSSEDENYDEDFDLDSD